MDRAMLKKLTEEYTPATPLGEARANGAADQEPKRKRCQLEAYCSPLLPIPPGRCCVAQRLRNWLR